ncbi:hypothetical protein B9W64_37640 [Streptomyces sp. CS159]|uniref:hypothetical protein n=1 Tax=Streptomyces sp. CS159 TaxID=1982762 RepID=UPI000B41980D|nr:hypothetical protein [Streptomyces sp. CS159]OVZ99518.1 hypothetical protein B9W64_37640 [Streptomyces sp. CS159]
MSVFTTTAYTTDKATPGQRRVMLAAVDEDGRLPAVANQRVLNSIPESWARTDAVRGGRFLTAEGRAALAPLGRYLLLARADPEEGYLSGSTGHHDMLALVRDGLAVLQDSEGNPMPTANRWERGNSLRITERGRRLVGMPLTAPEFAERFPVGGTALWKREGEPARSVRVLGWPLADGTVYVMPQDPRLSYAESKDRPVPAAQLHPAPQAPTPTMTDRSDYRRKTMTDSTPELPLDDELVALRGLAAAALEPMTPRANTWEQVKALEERATAGYELAERFTEFDRRATADRWAPREWRRGRDLSAEEVAALIEQWPDLAALGSTFVRHLAAAGFQGFQMANLVKQVQGRRGLPEIKAGDVVEAMLAGGGEPKTIRLKVDRTPWAGGPDSTVLSDGKAVTAVVTTSVRVVEDDGTTTARLVTDES